MNILHLEMMQTVAATGSLQQAAQQLFKTQSAISMALKKLEQEAGFALFDRSGYRLKLTAHGQQYLRQAEEVLRQHQRLQTLAGRLREGAEPHITLCYDHTCDAGLWLQHIDTLQTDFPATEIRIEGESQLRSLRRVNEGEVDLAICPWLPLFRQYGDFETTPIAPFELIVVIADSLVKRIGTRPTTRQQLLNLTMLLPQNLDVGISVDAILRLPSKRRIQANDVTTQRELLLAGMGWGIIPKHMVRPYLDGGQLHEISIPGFVQQVNLEVHMIRSAARTLGPAAQSLWQQALNHCG
ncbi:LysR family transcriptional regulator [Idiomarina sp. OT37-5b]|jgi:DNA-binding transcriptional LysR family regulator|uniref:LysR family transcriptional regulator n=1 Tax=Idiomarina aquatica TaxID=1327752 RepID=A0AA94EG89_9GAMM|nr:MULTISPECIES: LysR family transcriptional regulator [Idiomarina]AVJ55163.1 LysR family transcriptional regulator [Idiomarina sp. OT37-5b]RUO45308.1 LysR family transcriptional regulator [Idiomarina aquatica]